MYNKQEIMTCKYLDILLNSSSLKNPNSKTTAPILKIKPFWKYIKKLGGGGGVNHGRGGNHGE